MYNSLRHQHLKERRSNLGSQPWAKEAFDLYSHEYDWQRSRELSSYWLEDCRYLVSAAQPPCAMLHGTDEVDHAGKVWV
jgi:hypothetical protein